MPERIGEQRSQSRRAERAGRQDAAGRAWQRRPRAPTRPIATPTGRRPTCTYRGSNEFVLGQLFQMMMLATVVEGRLIGINPYGQPGVEAYKKNMNAILRGK